MSGHDKKKYHPVPYKSLNRGQVFTIHGSKDKMIKHSNAVAFNLKGDDIILSLYDPCYPKTVGKERYNTLMRHVLRQDLVCAEVQANAES